MRSILLVLFFLFNTILLDLTDCSAVEKDRNDAVEIEDIGCCVVLVDFFRCRHNTMVLRYLGNIILLVDRIILKSVSSLKRP